MRMKIVVTICGLMWLGLLVLKADPPGTRPISIVLNKNYSKTFAIRLNGDFVPGQLVMERLSRVMKNKEEPVVVLMPGEVRFDDWDNISGIVYKVGFLNVRYFVFSAETKMMVELDRHRAVPLSLNPGPREQRAARDNY